MSVCPLPISNYKTKYCRNHLDGGCPYGRYCRFAHSREERQHYRAVRERAMEVEEQLYTQEVKLQQLEERLIHCMENFIRYSDEIRHVCRRKVEAIQSRPCQGF